MDAVKIGVHACYVVLIELCNGWDLFLERLLMFGGMQQHTNGSDPSREVVTVRISWMGLRGFGSH